MCYLKKMIRCCSVFWLFFVTAAHSNDFDYLRQQKAKVRHLASQTLGAFSGFVTIDVGEVEELVDPRGQIHYVSVDWLSFEQEYEEMAASLDSAEFYILHSIFSKAERNYGAKGKIAKKLAQKNCRKALQHIPELAADLFPKLAIELEDLGLSSKQAHLFINFNVEELRSPKVFVKLEDYSFSPMQEKVAWFDLKQAGQWKYRSTYQLIQDFRAFLNK